MSLDKKIQDTFNPPPSMAGEDWLMPSDDLFDSIEQAIYNEPKKKKRAIWIWFLPILFITVLAIYVGFTSDIDSGELVDEWYEDIGKEAKDSRFIVVTESVEQKNKLNSSEEKLNENDLVENPSASLISSNYNKSLSSISNNLNINSLALVKNKNPVDFKSNSTINEKKTELSLLPNTIFEVESENLISEKDKELFEIAQLSAVRRSLMYNRNVPSSSLSPFITEVSESSLSGWRFKLATGVSSWNFDLNNNYKTVLQPAEFTSTDGKGYFLEGGVEKTFNKRLSFGFSASIDRNVFESGHNSAIDYNVLTELSDQSNDFDLTMASPLGFLESNIVVVRSVSADDHTDLIIDLDNSHTVTNIDLKFYSQFEILKFRKFSLGTQLGGGINYLSDIKNNLDHFGTSEFGFNARDSKIINDQSGLNLLRPFFNIGINVEYKWSRRISIGFSHDYRQDLNAIYNSGDYSTLISRQLSGLYITKSI